jgi:DNA polymerase III epsilon subunit-like protein
MIVVLDTETGGLDPATTSILSFGACLLENAANRTEIFIAESPYAVDAGALKVNQIDLVKHEKIAQKPKAAWAAVKAFLGQPEVTTSYDGGAVVAGHNVAFDIGYLRRLHRLSGDDTAFESIVSRRTLDTMVIAAFLKMTGLIPPDHGLSLTALLDTFEIKRDGAHTALADAVATAELLNTMADLVKVSR